MQAVSHDLTQVPVTDENVWLQFRDGDRDALGQIYFRYFRLLVQYGSGITTDRGLVRDCIHDLFVDLWSHRLRLAIPRSVKAYLLISVRRKVLRVVRRQRRLTPATGDQPDDFFVESREDQLIRDQMVDDQKAMLQQAMTRLTRRQREAIYLRYYASLSYAEISQVMKISADAIYNLVSNAIDVLQQQMPVMSR